ncbi:WD repeat-containing protein 17-like isoform X3 [Dreissena polymorpha]|nr:WD repeat-containing protein 17-like isoform X3 [Dreissena polymorpha]
MYIRKTISAISWNSRNPDILASASYENRIIIWDISKQKPIAIYKDTKTPPICVDWCYLHGEALSFTSGRGPVLIWAYRGSEISVTGLKDSSRFTSEITCFKWHPKVLEKAVVGHKDGSLSFCSIGGKSFLQELKPETNDDDEDDQQEDSVVSLAWDPLSVDYLLVAHNLSGVRLVDSSSLSIIMRFQLPSVSTRVKTLDWIHTAPGMFLTGDALSGNLRVWNVSMATPIEHIRIKKTGFHAVSVICDKPSTNQYISNQSKDQKSSTSQAQIPAKVNASYFALPPARLVCTFLDGGVGLYDLGKRKWEFLRDQGHIETIFDCEFAPHDANILATASFDGTIKLWDVASFTCLNTSPGNEGIIYTLSWAPSDLNCLVAGTSKLGLFIWDINKGKVITRYKEHGNNPVYKVAWNPKDSRRIMSTGGDGYCIVRQVDGEIIQKYKHPGPVYGCDWCPNNKDMLATGCEDGNVRVFYTATSTDKPLKIFSGHTSKVFHVKWSPLKENLLCSGSDDMTVRIWDYSQDTCTHTLRAHTGPVRGLMWNPEVPYLVISGSWDSAICFWDIRTSRCLHMVQDHGADVYGLACHPSRPFILASSSRDSTVRLWSITSLVQPIEMNILAGKSWSQVLGTIECAMQEGTDPILTGKVSRELRSQAESHPQDTRNRVLRTFSKFFLAPAGSDNLWELVSVVKGMDDTMLSENYSKGIMHAKHLVKFGSSEAQQLEMAKLTKFGGGVGSGSKDERLRQAAMLHLKTGNVQRYCELLVELGDWERALAVAPGVSYSYWKGLSKRYAKYLMAEESDSAAVFCTAVGDTDALVQFFTSRGQMSDAVLAAQVACEGLTPGQHQCPSTGHLNGQQTPQGKANGLLLKAIDYWSAWQMSNGSPVAGACCCLAADDKQGALCRLIQGNELELAVAMGTVLGVHDSVMSVAMEMLSRRCERLSKWYLAIDLLLQTPDSRVALAQCCARYSGSVNERNTLLERANLPPVTDCFQEAQRLKRQSDVFECVLYFLLSDSPEAGIELGLEHVKNRLESDSWTADDVFPLLHLLGSVRTDSLQAHSKKPHLFTACCYIGALVAIRREYYPVVLPLFKYTLSLLDSSGYVDIGVPKSRIVAECEAWQLVYSPHSRELNIDLLPAAHKQTYERLQHCLGVEKNKALMGPVCVASAHLPSHSDIHISCLTGDRIQGLPYFLEDCKSAMSHNEALMWSRVNPFSPLGTGYRMNPF